MEAVPRPDDSLRKKLQAIRAAKQAQKEIRIAIPGFDGHLVGRYHPLDWDSQRRITRENAKVTPEGHQELCIAADTLIAACDGVDALMDGATTELDVKLGLGLAKYLGVNGVENDRQAVFETFPGQMQIMAHFGQFMDAQGGLDEALDDELVGNSEAAS